MKASRTEMLPAEYLIVSKEFVTIWHEGEKLASDMKRCVGRMLSLLEGAGYTRTAALNKIARDHQQLDGFSLGNVKRNIPEEMINKSHSERIKQGKKKRPMSQPPRHQSSETTGSESSTDDTDESTSGEPDESPALPQLPTPGQPRRLRVRMNGRKYFPTWFMLNQKNGKLPEWYVALDIEGEDVTGMSELKGKELLAQ